MKILTPILALYFLVLFPAVHIAFSGNRFIYEFWPILYFAITLALALVFKRISLQELGFRSIWKALALGALLGMLPVISVPLLDGLLVKAGLSQSELFAGADLRIPDEMGFDMSFSANIFTALIVPFLDQVFVVGLVVNSLLKKQQTGQAIIGGGLIYSLCHFKPSLGNLFLGMISAGLLRATGSIIAPILVHTGFAIAEILIVFQYPRLISILVFFV
ncbi:MAG: CPBP family intramembrane metalloprotease [Nitrospinae bacterium]|nr:CPBP family intramembrane metalloprotease [Nitrospinota bacterium]MBL7021266.1 CPBP family intramembrane metalloprotease [Nitrospinaceae bacterium]